MDIDIHKSGPRPLASLRILLVASASVLACSIVDVPLVFLEIIIFVFDCYWLLVLFVNLLSNPAFTDICYGSMELQSDFIDIYS